VMPKTVTVETWRDVLRRGVLRFNGRLAADKSLTGLVPELRGTFERLRLGGSASVIGRLDASGEGLNLRAQIDAERAAFAVGERFVKPEGLSAGARLEVRLPPDLSRVRVTDLRANAGDLHLLAGGTLAPERGGGRAWRLKPSKLHVSVWTRRAEMLDTIIPELGPYRLAGEAIVEGQWVSDHGGSMPYLSVHAGSLGGKWRGKTVGLAGRLIVKKIRRDGNGRWTIGGISTDKLEMQAGKNHAWLIADLTGLDRAPKGTFSLLGKYIDTQDLARWISGPKTTTRPAAASKRHAAARARAEALVKSFTGPVLAGGVKGTVRVGNLRIWDANVRQYYDARDLKLDASAVRGAIKLSYACGLNGGSVHGGITVDLKDKPAGDKPVTTSVWQDVRDVAARENIQPLLAMFFPGNTVYGQFNRRQDVKVPLVDMIASTIEPDYPVHPAGTAKTVTVDGMTQGRAAPKFVTALFPGLNMASYRYLNMTSFSELQADGTTYNDMIFTGKIYDLYIEGTTDAKKIGRYEIGLILLGTPQTPEWNHTWKQGRLPILDFKARIEGGKLHDVAVSYPWPNESLGVILLKNNILYRAYLASQKK